MGGGGDERKIERWKRMSKQEAHLIKMKSRDSPKNTNILHIECKKLNTYTFKTHTHTN